MIETAADRLNVFGNCKGCPFKSATCRSKGPLDSPVVIVGESPGQNEVKTGIPFTGQSGQLLDKIIKKYGVEPYITNAFSCYPGSGKGKTQQKVAQACRACHDRLIGEITAHPREVILALGAGAIWSLMDDYSLKITAERGKLFKQTELAKIGIVASVHPAFILRGGGSLPKFKEDIRYAFDLNAGVPPRNYVLPKFTVLKTSRQIELLRRRLIKRAYKAGTAISVASDLETSGFFPVDDRMLCGGVAYDARHVYMWDEGLCADTSTKALFELPVSVVRWIWQNGKFDNGFLLGNGIQSRVDEDTMLLSYAWDETGGIHDLAQLAKDWLGAPNWKDALEPYLPYKGASYSYIPRDILIKYAANDISNTLQIWDFLSKRVAEDPKLTKLYKNLLIPASSTLTEIELNGLRVDVKQVLANRKRLLEEMEAPRETLNRYNRRLYGTDVNPNSPAQMCRLLFDGIKLPVKRERSTDKKVIELLPPHPAKDALQLYRKLAKAYSTYVHPLIPPEMRDNEKAKKKVYHTRSDGKVHTTYKLHGTVTGRLSSSKPNIQNIPRDPDLRSQFIADPGYIFIEPDLNQAELRCLAILSGDPTLIDIYVKNEISLHDKTTQGLFGIVEQYDEATYLKYTKMFNCTRDRIYGEQKMRGKAVNFGIVYGREAGSLAEEFRVPVYEAQRWIDGWATTYPVAWDFIKACRRAPLKGQVITTPFGRKRRFGIVTKENQKSLENEAANFPHQSIASDINLTAATKALPKLKSLGVKICNLVHDSTLLMAPMDADICVEATKHVMELMEAEGPLQGLTRVPFKADFKVGLRWGHLSKDIKLADLPAYVSNLAKEQAQLAA